MFQMICDCKKELENDITHYRRGKLKKIRFSCQEHTLCKELYFSTSAMAVSLSGIGIIVGALMADLAGFSQ